MKPSAKVAAVIVFLAIITDLLSKYLVFYYYDPASPHCILDFQSPHFPSRVLIDGFLNFTCSYNRGIAFGLGQTAHGNKIFLVISSIIVLVMIKWYRKIAVDRLSNIAYAMIIGGAIGNIFDRPFYPGVRDFIDFHVYDKFDYPIFNLADSYITIGVALIFLQSFLEIKREKAKKKACQNQ